MGEGGGGGGLRGVYIVYMNCNKMFCCILTVFVNSPELNRLVSATVLYAQDKTYTSRAENNNWPVAIFRAIFYNGHPKFIQMANQNFSLANQTRSLIFSSVLLLQPGP